MNSKATKEQRIYPRRPIRTQVVFENEDSEGVLYFFSTDISAGGLFIETDLPIKLGTQVFLRFRLTPDSKPIQATGEVVRVMKEQISNQSEKEKLNETTKKIGIGIRFIYIHPLDRQLIQDFIENI